jgi:hypothetical protein
VSARYPALLRPGGHLPRGSFPPFGKGVFSTRSTSMGISEAARILSDKLKHPDENDSSGLHAARVDGAGFGGVGARSAVASWHLSFSSLASVSARSLSMRASWASSAAIHLRSTSGFVIGQRAKPHRRSRDLSLIDEPAECTPWQERRWR